MAAASMKRAGYERLIAARAIVTTPSSIGWRSTSSTFFRNSGSSSRNSTPPGARLPSPGPRGAGCPVREAGNPRGGGRPGPPGPGHAARFGRVLLRQDQRLDPRRARGEGHGERAAHRADRTFEPELAEHRDGAQTLFRDLLGGGQNTERDRQVECRAVLADVGRREVHRDALQGKGVAGVRERGVDSLTAFLHGTLRQSHGRECREAVRDVGLHVHEIGIDAEDRGGADAGEHEPYLRSRRAGGGRRSCAVRSGILRWGVQSGLTCRSVAPYATPCPQPASPLRVTAPPPATYLYA